MALCTPVSRVVLVLALLGTTALPVAGEHSELWGAAGEAWQAEGRLPDFSFAGYHRGEDPIPRVEAVADVTTYGADGSDDKDDTEAFKAALRDARPGAIDVPAGRYLITDILEIRRPGVVLRGAGPESTFLEFSLDLQDVKPDMGATTAGAATSNYSWSGGFVQINGERSDRRLADVVEQAARGERVLALDSTESISAGAAIEIRQSDDAGFSLVDHLYAGDPGGTKHIPPDRRSVSFVAWVVRVEHGRVTINRPLPFDIRPEWRPEVRQCEWSVTESGVESLSFEFRLRPYLGHFTERGANAIALTDVSDCWVRNLRIHNADSGCFFNGQNCTLEDVVLVSERPRDAERNSTGHHGIQVGGDDNLIRRFSVQTRFIHDLTVEHCHGNVFCDGRGEDLSLDHHKCAPFDNLFTELDAGVGTQLWVCGGGWALGKNCAARGTFWNIRAQQPLAWPPEDFAPAQINLVGLTTREPTRREPNGRWFEAIPPSKLQPQNLWEAQVERRLGKSQPR